MDEQTKREQLEKKAENGSITAIQMLERLDFQARMAEKKQELLGGSKHKKPETELDLIAEKMELQQENSRGDVLAKLNDLDISEIENYISSGNFKQLPQHMSAYLNWMKIAHDKYYQFKSKHFIIKFLMAVCEDEEGNKISYYLANKVFSDMRTFFYSDKDLKKNSWYLYMFERVMMTAEIAWEFDDMEGVRKAMALGVDIMEKVKIDKTITDPRLLESRPRFYFTSAKELGIPEVDRNELGRQIDGFPIPEKAKLRVKSDLGIERRNLLDGDTLKEEIKETE